MAKVDEQLKIDVALQQCGEQGDCIRFNLGGQELFLSPQQARALASELIQTVYRAEVKNSLKRSAVRTTGDRTSDVMELRAPHAA